MPLHDRRSTGALKSISFFEGWSDDELEHFERTMERLRFPAGDVLITEGQPGETFLVLTAGEADVRRGGESVARLGEAPGPA